MIKQTNIPKICSKKCTKYLILIFENLFDFFRTDLLTNICSGIRILNKETNVRNKCSVYYGGK